MNSADDPAAGLDGLSDAIGYVFRDVSLLETAVTHPSAPRDMGMPDYQRLEFLGDAVLELCASRSLFEKYPEAKEGELTQKRIRVVQESSLLIAARKLRLDSYIRLSPGDRSCEAHQRASVMTDVFEAILGAIYLDGGLAEADAFARRALSDYDPDNPAFAPNWKSILQEKLQSLGDPAPTYRAVKQSGPAHAPVFTVAAECGRKILGQGVGRNKKEAEQAAAMKALAKIAGDC